MLGVRSQIPARSNTSVWNNWDGRCPAKAARDCAVSSPGGELTADARFGYGTMRSTCPVPTETPLFDT
jgi:hypothetical protein